MCALGPLGAVGGGVSSLFGGASFLPYLASGALGVGGGGGGCRRSAFGKEGACVGSPDGSLTDRWTGDVDHIDIWGLDEIADGGVGAGVCHSRAGGAEGGIAARSSLRNAAGPVGICEGALGGLPTDWLSLKPGTGGGSSARGALGASGGGFGPEGATDGCVVGIEDACALGPVGANFGTGDGAL